MATMAVVRVVAGTARGRKLMVPPGDRVRPTSDRVREAVCNALGSMDAIRDARVLDLFAGSGALGIEAMSRGAAFCDFVEVDRATRAVLEKNVEILDSATRQATTIVESTGERHLAGGDADTYDLVFADPPYAYDGWPDLLVMLDRVVSPCGVVVVESDRAVDPAGGWEILRSRRYGSTVVDIHVRIAPAGAEK